MSCQESAEKSEPVCATQMATSSPNAVPALSPASEGSNDRAAVQALLKFSTGRRAAFQPSDET